MFGRGRKATRTGTLLLAAVVGRVAVDESTSAEALVRQLRAFLDGVEEAARGTGGSVLQWIGNCSLAAWTCDAKRPERDPFAIGARIFREVRRALAARHEPSWMRMKLCAGFAAGECVYEEQGGRVVEAMGHAWLRVARDVPLLGASGEDVIVLDRSLVSLLSGDPQDLGNGWYRTPARPGPTC